MQVGAKVRKMMIYMAFPVTLGAISVTAWREFALYNGGPYGRSRRVGNTVMCPNRLGSMSVPRVSR